MKVHDQLHSHYSTVLINIKIRSDWHFLFRSFHFHTSLASINLQILDTLLLRIHRKHNKTTTKTMKNINTSALLFCFFFLCGSGVIAVYAAVPAAGGGGDAATQKECGEQLQKVMACLDYAQGKAEKPSAQCCGSVKDIKENDPKCLCYIIQQAHGGSSGQLKSLGIQEAKLLALPSVCQLQNASISNCPKLLGLSPGSPDAAIFSGNASTTPTPTGKSASESADKSDGTKLGHYLVGPTSVTAIALAIFFYAFPTGAYSMFFKWD